MRIINWRVFSNIKRRPATLNGWVGRFRTYIRNLWTKLHWNPSLVEKKIFCSPSANTLTTLERRKKMKILTQNPRPIYFRTSTLVQFVSGVPLDDLTCFIFGKCSFYEVSFGLLIIWSDNQERKTSTQFYSSISSAHHQIYI